MKTSNKILLIAFIAVVAIFTTILIVAKKHAVINKLERGPKIMKEKLLDPFNKIDVSGGFEIEFIKFSDSKIEVNADSVAHQHIRIDVKDSILTINSDAFNLSHVKCKLYSPSFSGIVATGGSLFYTNDSLLSDPVSLKATSGSTVKFKGSCGDLELEAKSGSSIEIFGLANSVVMSASAGSEINAKEFKTVSAVVKASSGSDIYVNSENIRAEVSSGATIFYNKDANLKAPLISSGGEIKPFN
ncbi:MAG TPA: head GIN domain-containing protein [Salinivirgaceae bacterium]|nr:head GIN domain-containing protein [Salinivirgaceae bacterium]